MNRIDYEATVHAANDAQNSAQQAQNNAAEAASKASLTSVHEVSSHGGSSYHGPSEHGGGHLDAYGSQKTLTVTSAKGSQQQSSSSNGQNAHNGSSEKKPNDSSARSSNQVKASAPSAEAIAANHNYSNKDFKPSHQYSYAGYWLSRRDY